MVTSLELLAPAGDADIGIAAIDHGADAVYIGAPKFSARAAAGVSLSDIARLIKHAHFYFARVYVALNTILTDQEISESLNIIRELYQLGTDGLIIQDVGLLELDLPPIPLIASTQMHNNTPEKVKFLEDVGFKRVILARELSLEEIAEIRKQTGRIELESFVHGALCVSYSGQCYMSQAVAGRSGNRGVCAQPCRSHYNLTDGAGNKILQNKYLLSLKDLNLMNRMPDLVAAGITSFKIEGRYKGIDYVKNVTAAYRQVIDQFISSRAGYRRGSSGTSEITFTPDVNRTFNRGYSQYFILGKREKIASIDTPKSIGQYLGKITSVGKDFFQMARHDLQNGDGLCFFTRQKDLAGFRVNRVEKEKIYPNSMRGLETGTPVYRNLDRAFTGILKKPSARRLITVKMDFVQNDTFIKLTVKDEDGSTAEMVREVLFEPSRNPERAREQIEKHLTSTGNTSFRAAGLTIQPHEPGFLSASLLNGIRRDALDKLTQIRSEAYPRQEVPFTPGDAPYPETKLDFRANVFNDLARKFYERHGAIVTEPAFEALSGITGKTVMTTRYCIRHQLDLCPKLQNPELPIKEPWKLKDAHHTYRLEFDCRQCRMFLILEDT
ncbi:MAG: collagenase-like protease [Deltaproteobacteria bacterium HGW-Deltaproteobacteria-13]|jgi:putative protease|nr:MAG: collagenase-like protease [Deltaproteobacteria bacterium HGW-Deltaproteobacteria-13]